nr:hypothetical protein [Tanacetum cinerariifolium]
MPESTTAPAEAIVAAEVAKLPIHLEEDKVAQAIKITKLKQRVRRLEQKRKLKASGLKRLRKVGTAKRVESSANTVMDDQEDASKHGGGIAELDADEDVTLEEVDTEKDAEVQGRLPESQAQASAPRRRRGVIIQDPEEAATASLSMQLEVKSKDKGALQFHLGIPREKEIEEEDGKRKSKSSKQKAAKKQKIDEEVEELKTHLQIVSNDEDSVYTEATPLALKVPVVDYQIHPEHNKPYYKIIREDRSYQLFLSFISTYGLAKVKSWKLLESCGVHIITFTTTQMILLVERVYLLTRSTLDQMLNNVRLEVEEESEVPLELLRFVRRHQQKGYKPE